MFSRHILAVLLLSVWTAFAEVEWRVGERDASPEPQWSYDTTAMSPSQSSAVLVISSLLASLSSDVASRTSSDITTSSITHSSPSSPRTQLSSTATITTSPSSRPTQLSSQTPITTDSTSSVIPTSLTTSLTTTHSPPSSTAAVSVSISSSTIDSRTQTIILAVCVTLLGLILLTIALFLFRRYRRRQSPFLPFTHRGASPIDDDEIATWRGNTQPMAKTPSTHIRNASSIVFQPNPGWTWTVSSTPDSSSPATSPPPGSGEALPYPPPPLVAHAPNARSGLTDGAIPGAAPFVSPARRHSRRLSKAQSIGHMRSKSRRSSVSISSIREPRTSISNGQWAEPEDWAVQRKRSNSGSRAAKTAVGRTSMGDDVRPGGLSPRPIPAANVLPPEIPGFAS